MFDSTPLFAVPEGVVTRWASPENPSGEVGKGGQANAGRKGRACFPVKAGEAVTLAEARGPGMVRRIWITIVDRGSKMLRGLRLDCYWDGSARPAVSVPVGDFFGHNVGRMVTFQSYFLSSPEGRSFSCLFPMPFRKGMKIVLTNETDADQGSLYYDVDYTLGDRHADDALYFHAHWRRENPTTMQRDYELLPKVAGRGRYLGVNVGVIANTELYFKTWWGEGEVKAYLDGDTVLPTLCGTGTEDYIGTAWGQGRYDHLFQGCPLADGERMQYGFYRFHVADPVYFRRDIRVTIHQLGCWDPAHKLMMTGLGQPVYKAGAGLTEVDLSPKGNAAPWGLFERQDDWSSCAYFYLNTPASDLPALAPVDQRVAGLAK